MRNDKLKAFDTLEEAEKFMQSTLEGGKYVGVKTVFSHNNKIIVAFYEAIPKNNA